MQKWSQPGRGLCVSGRRGDLAEGQACAGNGESYGRGAEREVSSDQSRVLPRPKLPLSRKVMMEVVKKLKRLAKEGNALFRDMVGKRYYCLPLCDSICMSIVWSARTTFSFSLYTWVEKLNGLPRFDRAHGSM